MSGASEPQEELKRMSFGDHLDELRRRLLWCAGTLFLSVMVMLPFKDAVTSIYTEPYDSMWFKAYADFLVEIEADFVASPGPEDAQTRLAAADFVTAPLVEQVLLGKYPEMAELKARSGFPGEVPPASAKGSAKWDIFTADFSDYAQALRTNRDATERVIWHRERKELILADKYRPPNLIETKGGFLLKRTLASTGGLEDFWTFMAAALLFSAILASPVLVWHTWAFIAAGLYHNERAIVYRAMPLAIALLIAGVSFGFFLMVPYGLYFLTQLMDWTQVAPLFTVALYFKFFLTLTVALGLVFQLPILMVALQKVGLVQFGMVLKNWRWVILGMFVISAMLTPPDPVTQVMMVTPMISLFLLGLFLMWRIDKKQKAAGVIPAA